MQTSSRASGQAIAWWQFIRERFDPVSHLLMIGLFFVAHLVLARSVYLEPLNRGSLFALFVGTLAFFFKLRLYDEIKDFQVDKKFNPTRPLARGLLNHRDLYWAIALCIVIELVAFGLQGMAALISDLLESERLSGSHAALQRTPTDVVALARDVVGELQASHAGAARVTVSAPVGLPLVSVDASRVRLLLRNLIDNAVAYGRRARLSVAVQGEMISAVTVLKTTLSVVFTS